MTTTRGGAFVAEARSWLSTPFRHMGREKGLGADCAGVILGSAAAVGLTDFQPAAYPPAIDAAMLTEQLGRVARRLEPEEVEKPGDLLQFEVSGQAQHLGLFTGADSFIHAWETAGMVVETALVPWWRGRIAARWRLFSMEGEA